jgi:DUF971 family protein
MQVENMAYFDCDLGKRYYPFGRGGRDRVLAKLDTIANDILPANTNEGTRRRIQECPFVCIPLAASISLNTEGVSPVVVKREPACDVSAIYDGLVDDAVSEMFKLYVEARTIPHVSHVQSREGILLRYFTPSQATEYFIPSAELRQRDPKTGKKRVESDEDIAVKRLSAQPVAFDLKGNYGVSIIWDDGHFADIYPYDVLRLIAEELNQD